MCDAAVTIGNLVARYAELIDAGDFDGVADLLGEASVGSVGEGPLLSGRDAIHSLFAATTRRYPDGTPGTKHVTSNLIVEVSDGEQTARARSYFTVLQAVPGLPLQPIVAGRYRDRFTLVAGRWRFTERRFSIDLVGDLSHHLLTRLPDPP
ncbi:MAG: nuclear transport factor 2 family protein [Acidimicrobiales bacterium]